MTSPIDNHRTSNHTVELTADFDTIEQAEAFYDQLRYILDLRGIPGSPRAEYWGACITDRVPDSDLPFRLPIRHEVSGPVGGHDVLVGADGELIAELRSVTADEITAIVRRVNGDVPGASHMENARANVAELLTAIHRNEIPTVGDDGAPAPRPMGLTDHALTYLDMRLEQIEDDLS